MAVSYEGRHCPPCCRALQAAVSGLRDADMEDEALAQAGVLTHQPHAAGEPGAAAAAAAMAKALALLSEVQA